MMLFLKKNLQSIKIQFIHKLSTSSLAQNQNQPPKHPFLVSYLVNSCEFSSKEAAKVSNKLPRIKPPSKPDSVIDFFKKNGFSCVDIKCIVAAEPSILCADPEKTLVPKIQSLEGIGFCGSELVRLVTENPKALRYCNSHRNIEILREIIGSNERVLKLCKKNQYIVGSNLEGVILPNLALLRGCGIPDRQIATVLKVDCRMITYNVDYLKQITDRVKEFGIPCGSGMFVYLLCALCLNTREVLDAKMKLLKSFGWSDENVLSTIRKAPHVMRFNLEALRSRIQFLLKETKCEPSYLARHPVLLAYSLKKRVFPRFQVLQNLKSRGLLKKTPDLLNVVNLSDEKFRKRYVLPHLNKLPVLLEMYVAACDHKQPVSV